MRDLHQQSCKLDIKIDGTTYKGFLDVGVVSYGVIGESCTRQVRLGVMVKHTKDQKARHMSEITNGKTSPKISCFLNMKLIG